MSISRKAQELKQLHEAPEILQVVNVWDAITTKVVSSLDHTKAIATAGHSIAAAHGFKDGEIPLDLALREAGDNGTPVVLAAPESPGAQPE